MLHQLSRWTSGTGRGADSLLAPMIISHQQRFIFFHNPKTAGISLRAVLLPYHDDKCPPYGTFRRPPLDYAVDFAHLRLWEIESLFPWVLDVAPTYRSVIFVRDPYRRFVSAVDQHFKTFLPDMPLPALHMEQQMLVAEAFIDEIINPKRVRTDHRFVHFSPQVWFFHHNGLRLACHILPMDDRGAFIGLGLESLGLPAQPVARDNKSRSDLSHILRSPKIRAFVRDFYAEDFAFFAADPALAHLTGDVHRAEPAWTTVDGTVADGTSQDNNRRMRPAVESAFSACDPRSVPAPRHTDVRASESVHAQMRSAAMDMAAGRAREAFDRIKAVLAIHPDVPAALGMLGQIAVLAGHPAIGLAPLQRAVALDPRPEHRVWLALCLEKLGCYEDAMNVRWSQSFGKVQA